MANTRSTEQAYIRGLKHGFAMAKAQYEELLAEQKKSASDDIKERKMFYLETKDGDKFVTQPNSDDKAEFEKVLKDKLGESAAELFTMLLEDAKNDQVSVLTYLSKELDTVLFELNELSKSSGSIGPDDIKCYADEVQRIRNKLDKYL